jgi:hypothetical protein
MIYEKNSFIYCDCDSAGTSCILCIARAGAHSRAVRLFYQGGGGLIACVSILVQMSFLRGLVPNVGGYFVVSAGVNPPMVANLHGVLF